MCPREVPLARADREELFDVVPDMVRDIGGKGISVATSQAAGSGYRSISQLPCAGMNSAPHPPHQVELCIIHDRALGEGAVRPELPAAVDQPLLVDRDASKTADLLVNRLHRVLWVRVDHDRSPGDHPNKEVDGRYGIIQTAVRAGGWNGFVQIGGGIDGGLLAIRLHADGDEIGLLTRVVELALERDAIEVAQAMEEGIDRGRWIRGCGLPK